MAGTHTTLNIARLRRGAKQTTKVLQVLANENRLLLLCQLTQGERSVKELEALLYIHQPTLSQQLGVLRVAGLVNTRRDGKRIHYSIRDARVLALLGTLYTLYCPPPPRRRPGP
jgi:DNA-binding transcriptional ArsR family regulator